MKHILIVDDNLENRYLLRALLEGSGFTVAEAPQGMDALTKARQWAPDLIISDLLMPVLDGYSLLQHWKADEVLKTIPFIVYTATFTDPKDQRLALALGADAFVIKPCEPEPLLAIIQEKLDKAGCGELPATSQSQPEDITLLKEYNEILVRKLEKKVFQLEQANRELQEEIVEHKRTEKALRLRDQAIQAASQGIIITDPTQPDNPIVYANDGFEQMTGYPLEVALGHNCRFLQGPNTDLEAVARLRAAIAASRACTVEILNYRQDGTPFWNALSVNPVTDEQGTLKYFVGVQSDVTERKKLEEQLRQSQKLEAIGRLAGGVAHDFNNLLTVIISHSEQVVNLPEISPSIRKSVQAIREAGDRAAALTRQLLGFSRQTMLQPRVLDLNSIIANTAKMLVRLIGEDIQISTVLDPNLKPVKVDPTQLDQILINLAVNARDAMPYGGKLSIETANILFQEDATSSHLDCKAGLYVMLAITDTGCGMPPEILAHIFEPFFTTKEVGKGTGLGLAMVFGIVKQSEGTIHVYSEPGQGTTFKIYFPAMAAQAGLPIPETNEEEGLGSETILLIEDDEGVRQLVLTSLELYGYKVLAAQDGQEAFRIANAQAEPIDLVLTDIVMPHLNGPQVAKQLKMQFPHLKVLFMSGYTDDTVIRHGLLEAQVAFIQKPFTPLSLTQKIRQVLDGKSPSKG
ncbi:MAG: response regulator [Blastocatellia bacterium]|nr:response regulator [Blastocatellia bacterium]